LSVVRCSRTDAVAEALIPNGFFSATDNGLLTMD
jgi:hypothetical protein